jgi:hypothetical protein
MLRGIGLNSILLLPIAFAGGTSLTAMFSPAAVIINIKFSVQFQRAITNIYTAD